MVRFWARRSHETEHKNCTRGPLRDFGEQRVIFGINFRYLCYQRELWQNVLGSNGIYLWGTREKSQILKAATCHLVGDSQLYRIHVRIPQVRELNLPWFLMLMMSIKNKGFHISCKWFFRTPPPNTLTKRNSTSRFPL